MSDKDLDRELGRLDRFARELVDGLPEPADGIIGRLKELGIEGASLEEGLQQTAFQILGGIVATLVTSWGGDIDKVRDQVVHNAILPHPQVSHVRHQQMERMLAFAHDELQRICRPGTRGTVIAFLVDLIGGVVLRLHLATPPAS